MNARNLTKYTALLIALSTECVAIGDIFIGPVMVGVQQARVFDFPTMNLHVPAGTFSGQTAGTYVVEISILNPTSTTNVLASYHGIGYCNPTRMAVEREMKFGDGTDGQIFEVHAYCMQPDHGRYGAPISVKIISGQISPHVALTDMKRIKAKISSDRQAGLDWLAKNLGGEASRTLDPRSSSDTSPRL